MADAEQAVLTSSAKNFDVSGERGSESICLCSEIKGSLKIQPETRGVAKASSESECGVRSDRAFSMDDLIDPASRHVEALGKPILRESERL